MDGMASLGQALDRAAARAARGLLAWSARHAGTSRRGWIVALRHELHQIDGGWNRLAWAVDGLRVVYLTPPPAGHDLRHEWPESWCIAAGGLLLGTLVWLAFVTHVPNMEQIPAEMVFGFLTLYCYSVGFLSGRRTGKVGPGSWAGATCGLAFGLAVCLHMIAVAFADGPRASIRYGPPNQVAIAWSGVVFFLVLGAICGALGARSAIRAYRQGH
jgi:hypothetical protein